jgi:hypothetical protein
MIRRWTSTLTVHGPSAKVRAQMPLTLSIRKLQRAISTIHYREPSANIAIEPHHSENAHLITGVVTCIHRIGL